MTAHSSSYSADVDMFLVLDDRKLSLGQLGPAHCVLEEATAFPPGQGEIVLIVDGGESRLPVFFPEGASATSCRVSYHLQSTAPAAIPTAAITS
jgi:hypothetical protein